MRRTVGLAVLIIGASVTACTAASGAPGDRDAKPRAPSVDLRTPGTCVATERLIPTCGAWWGIAPDTSSGTTLRRAVESAERRMGRRADIVHVTHRGAEPFPTKQERQVAAGGRLLLISWKPAPDRTWAEVAGGAIDRRIDRLAAHITRTFPHRFFLAIDARPEGEVRQAPGRSAADYAAMFRHVVNRLRERGVRNAVTVLTYTGAPGWTAKPWFERLYPGDDVVDWVAFTPYAGERVTDFAGLMAAARPGRPGFYHWLQERFPAKPIMLAEWGVAERPGAPRHKRDVFASADRQITHDPQLKALIYADSPARGDTRFDTTPAAGRAFARLARNPRFTATRVPAG
ncbi:MAG: hypothetical protein QM207_11005 [Thermobispora sp.]|nr:hypothetical protein [Thermobispora sp.]